MAVKLRLQRKGRKKAPFYHIVVADGRSPRDGRFIEKIGTYNPLTIPATIELNREKAYEWLMKGAQPTDTVNAILRVKGVLLRKHLEKGVAKGALTQEQADAKLEMWIEGKETKVTTRKEVTAKEKAKFIASVDGKPKAKVVVAPPPPPPAPEPEPVAEAPAAEVVAETAAEVVEAPVEAAVETVAEVVEAPVETAVETVAEVVEAAPVEAAVETVAEVVEAPVEAAVEAAPEVVAEIAEPAAEEAPAEEAA